MIQYLMYEYIYSNTNNNLIVAIAGIFVEEFLT
jgi:hypothetical protein